MRDRSAASEIGDFHPGCSGVGDVLVAFLSLVSGNPASSRRGLLLYSRRAFSGRARRGGLSLVGLEFWCAEKGSPAPIDPPKLLLVRGFDRPVRSPKDVRVPLIVPGESLFSGSAELLSYAAVIVIGFNLFVVCCEAPSLQKSMGRAYAQYWKHVPRWIPSPGLSGAGNAL